MLYALGLVELVGPYVLLLALGIVLLRRHRTTATALVTVGFAAVVLSLGASWFISFQSTTTQAQGGLAVRFGEIQRLISTIAGYAGTIGMWSGAIGLLWHGLMARHLTFVGADRER